MPWNEPGSGNGGKDPWSGGGRNQGPPELDELINKMKERFGGIFGGGGGGGGQRKFVGGPGKFSLGLIAGIIALVWIASGIYIVDAGTRGVVLRFGAYQQSTMPGPHWHIPYPIEEVQIVNVEQRRFVELGYRSTDGRNSGAVIVPSEALMLTQDENIVNIQLAVQYQVKDAKAYLFNVRDPDLTLKQVAESSLREVVGKRRMDFVLTEGRADVVARTKVLMQIILDEYKTGLIVSEVNLQDAQPPEEVQDAFADAIKAREDEVRQINEAEAYSNDIIPKARGAAARQMEEADAYKESVIAQAQGESERFTNLLGAYDKAPEVTRKRLYLETLESIMSKSSKVAIDVEGSNNLLYLPLDRLMEGRSLSNPTLPLGSSYKREQSSNERNDSGQSLRQPRGSR